MALNQKSLDNVGRRGYLLGALYQAAVERIESDKEKLKFDKYVLQNSVMDHPANFGVVLDQLGARTSDKINTIKDLLEEGDFLKDKLTPNEVSMFAIGYYHAQNWLC